MHYTDTGSPRTEQFAERAQYYAAKAFGQMNQKVLFLAITDFLMFPEKPGYKSSQDILDNSTKNFSFTFLELPKFNKTIDELVTIEDKWMYFFKEAPHTDLEGVEKMSGPNSIMRQALNVIAPLGWSEADVNSYEREKKSQMDFQSMLDYARAEGVRLGVSERIAKKMLLDNIDIKTISLYTGLSEQEISQL